MDHLKLMLQGNPDTIKITLDALGQVRREAAVAVKHKL